MDFVQPFDPPPQQALPSFNVGALNSASDRPTFPQPGDSHPSQHPPLSPRAKLGAPEYQDPKNEKPEKADSHHVPFSYAFDIDTYPMTNPPLFDSTMYLNYGNDGQPPMLRRRISISNGQIGQIVSHEAVFDDVGVFGSDVNMHNDVQVKVENPTALIGDPSHAGQDHLASAQPSQDFAYANQMKQLAQRQHLQQQQHQQQQQLKEQQQQQQQLKEQQQQQRVAMTPSNSAAFAGVPPPNHQLLYNNEVIFNPNNGPIPGTAAWKKDRLLERNRVAASKCRQRKKEAQRQMSVELQDLKNDNQKLRADLENYNKFYTLVQRYFSNTAKFETSKNYEMYEVINGLVNKTDEAALLKSLTELKINEIGGPSNENR